MSEWKKKFKIDPLKRLTATQNRAILYFTQKDLLEKKVEPVNVIWELSIVKKILKMQQKDGSWKYPGGGKENIRSQEDYNQLETYRALMELVEKYGFNKDHHTIKDAAEFLFSCQSDEGDFEGIYGHQYSPNYSAGIIELLIKAGYGDDPRIEKGFKWLLSIRQDDGGWVVAMRTRKLKYADALGSSERLRPITSKPFSHLITGIVLRAFAAHPRYCKSKDANDVGKLMISRFFQPDKYPDRKKADYWEKLTFPFRWTDILSSLDSLSFLGFSRSDPKIEKALNWLVSNQEDNGLWKAKLASGKGKDKDVDLWLTLAVCRVFKRYFQ